ncbi:hypothetical protein E3P99_02946 [Wallemia hederae]|uniref:Adenylyl cyclase-associated protein n=1 Tax=Wallemia hederae TaxID=1540922 RepID=A0A4T0FI53_9BASI|nr:hypothetical protein E3P99_02946 [Wallemia hederae]
MYANRKQIPATTLQSALYEFLAPKPPTATSLMTNQIPNSGIISLNSVLKRLESTTSRLEDILLESTVLKSGNGGNSGNGTHTPAEPVAEEKEAASAETMTPFIQDYNDLLNNAMSSYTSLSAKIGGLVHTQSQHLEALLRQTLNIILIPASVSKQPKNLSTFQNSLSPLIELVNKVIQVSDSNEARKSQHSQQLKTVAEGVPAFGWFTITPKPAPYVQDLKDAAQFYANRVIKDHKDKDEDMVQWSKSYISLIDQLRAYVLKHHANGLAWNEQGGVAYEDYVERKNSDAGSASATTPTQQTPPTAPPAPPAPAAPAPPAAPAAPPAPAPSSSTPAQAGPEAVFAELNKGSDITKGLRKVDKSEMTHKNPELRQKEDGAAATSGGKKPLPPVAAKPKSLTRSTSQPPAKAAKPAKTELDGQKWFVENHVNTQHILIDDTKLSQTVNIFNCKNTVVEVKGKVNALTMVGCHKTSVLLNNLVSSLSITTSPNFTVQILGVAPTITVDATDVGQIYLSKECIEADTEIITAKTSSINISVPENEEGDFSEKPIPEQLKTVVRNGKLETTVVEHSG